MTIKKSIPLHLISLKVLVIGWYDENFIDFDDPLTVDY